VDAVIRIYAFFAGLLALIGAALGIYAKGRGDAKAKARMKASEDRIHTMEEMRRETAKAQAQDDADLVRSLTHKRG
jgi:hypothetical protein